MGVRRFVRYSIEGHPATSYGPQPKQANWTGAPLSAVQGYFRTNPWVDEKMPKNGGPYLPEMFPYGQGGRPKVWESKNNPAAGKAKSLGHLKRGEVLIARGRWPYVQLLKVKSIRETPKQTHVTVTPLGQWVPGEGKYIEDLESEGKVLKFTGADRHETMLTILVDEVKPYTLAAAPRRRAKRNRGLEALPKNLPRTRRTGRADDVSAIGGPTNKGKKTPWPIGDLTHAKYAVDYVRRGWGKAKDWPTVIRAVRRKYPHIDWDKYMRQIGMPKARMYSNSGARESARASFYSAPTRAAPWLGHRLTTKGESWKGFRTHGEAQAWGHEVHRGADVRFRNKRLKVGELIHLGWDEDEDITYKHSDPHGRSAFANSRRGW